MKQTRYNLNCLLQTYCHLITNRKPSVSRQLFETYGVIMAVEGCRKPVVGVCRRCCVATFLISVAIETKFRKRLQLLTREQFKRNFLISGFYFHQHVFDEIIILRRPVPLKKRRKKPKRKRKEKRKKKKRKKRSAQAFAHSIERGQCLKWIHRSELTFTNCTRHALWTSFYSAAHHLIWVKIDHFSFCMVPLPFKKKAIDLTPKCCHIGLNKVKQISGFDHFRTLSTGQPRRSNHSNRSNYSMRKKENW